MNTGFAVSGVLLGAFAYFLVRCVIGGFFTVDQNERAVKTILGKAQRRVATNMIENPVAVELRDSERQRYQFPQLEVLQPGFHFKWPWEQVHKVSIATETLNMAFDPEDPRANNGGTSLEAVTKDQLNVGLNGQLRYRVSEGNLYAYLFGVKNPIAHVMGYFISVLRQRIACFEAPRREGDLANTVDASGTTGVSINDLRKNLRDLNEHMDQECKASSARYGIVLDASLITGIDPPHEVESALAAINTAHNTVSSDVSLAQAAADQRIVQSRRAVEIATLEAQAEVEPLLAMASELSLLKKNGTGALETYVRNARLALVAKAGKVFMEVKS